MPDTEQVSPPTDLPAEFEAVGAPIITQVEAPTCDGCGTVGGPTEEVATGYDYESLTCRNRWRFVRCRVCGQV